MKYLTGKLFNVFGLGTLSVSPTAATETPAANLGDGKPSVPHVAGSIAADSYMQVRRNALTNGGFETSTLAGWTDNDQGTGTSTETTTGAEVRTGTKACEMTGSSAANYGSRYQDIEVSAGEYWKVTAYVIAIAAGVGKLFIRNLRTGKYWNGSAWGASRTHAATSSATSYTAITATFQIEDFDTCGADTVNLRVELVCESGNVAWDDVLAVSGVTFAAIFGHNYGGGVVPTVRSSDDGSSWTDRATMTVKRAAFYTTFSIIYAEYWRIVLVGTNFEAPYTGEAVLGQHQTCATTPKAPIVTASEIPGVRDVGPAGQVMTYNFATDARVDLMLTFRATSITAAKELADSIWLRSGQGRYPTIIVPVDSEANVYFGHLMEPHSEDRSLTALADVAMRLRGAPFPTVGA